MKIVIFALSYSGSLTTYPYQQIVAWTVKKDRIVLPDNLLVKLASTVKDKKGQVVKDNWRPTQNIVGRTVWLSRVKSKSKDDKKNKKKDDRKNKKTKHGSIPFLIQFRERRRL